MTYDVVVGLLFRCKSTLSVNTMNLIFGALMKDTLLTTLITMLFLLILVFGGALLIVAISIIVPLALLQCMFNSNPNNINTKNDSI